MTQSQISETMTIEEIQDEYAKRWLESRQEEKSGKICVSRAGSQFHTKHKYVDMLAAQLTDEWQTLTDLMDAAKIPQSEVYLARHAIGQLMKFGLGERNPGDYKRVVYRKAKT